VRESQVVFQKTGSEILGEVKHVTEGYVSLARLHLREHSLQSMFSVLCLPRLHQDRGCPTSGGAQGSLIESGVLLTRRPQEKTSVRIVAEIETLILIQAPCGVAFIRENDV
jgi:hypothetical protein